MRPETSSGQEAGERVPLAGGSAGEPAPTRRQPASARGGAPERAMHTRGHIMARVRFEELSGLRKEAIAMALPRRGRGQGRGRGHERAREHRGRGEGGRTRRPPTGWTSGAPGARGGRAPVGGGAGRWTGLRGATRRPDGGIWLERGVGDVSRRPPLRAPAPRRDVAPGQRAVRITGLAEGPRGGVPNPRLPTRAGRGPASRRRAGAPPTGVPPARRHAPPASTHPHASLRSTCTATRPRPPRGRPGGVGKVATARRGRARAGRTGSRTRRRGSGRASRSCSCWRRSRRS